LIGIAAPDIGSEEMSAVQAVLQSGMLAQGPKVSELEAAFAASCGTRYAVAVNSGTAALHSALHVAGVGAGDEVITTPFSFIATINPILAVGAKPVLVDIDPATYNIDVTKIEQAITPKTKAIVPVHLYGQPCDYAELEAIAKKHKLLIIEDACQAVGATYGDKKVGNLGDMGCFSFYATKNIMCGEGGMLTTNNEEYANAAKRFRQHGMTARYEYKDFGLNYRMSDLHAAIAVEQLKKADRLTQARQRNAELLYEGLKTIPGLVLPVRAAGRTHVFHQFTLRVADDFRLSRDELAQALLDKGITTGIYYPKPLHHYDHITELGHQHDDFPETNLAARQVLSVPIHSRLGGEDITYIIKTFGAI
jgi:perosamine synthetase